MANSWNGPQLGSPIRTDVPELQKKLIALLKQDPTSVADIPSGAKRLVNTSGVQWQVQQYNGSSWAAIGKLMHDVDKLDGYHAAITPAANTVAVRNADKKLEGDITGNAATASSAATLSETLPVNKGGTGATTSAAARTNLGVPPTSHASSSPTYGLATDANYGHVRSDGTTTNIVAGEIVVKDVAIDGDVNDLTSNRGVFDAKSLGGLDYNTLVDQGIYAVPASGSTNGPGFAAKVLVYRAKGSKLTAQIAIGASTFNVKWRYKNNLDEWSEWKRFILETSVATALVPGIVKPGTGLTVDATGTLNVSIDNTVTSTATGTTEPRSLADRFGDIANVKDFGAKGDGVQDDTDAFINAASTGRNVFVPDGKYVVSRPVSGYFFGFDSVNIVGGGCIVHSWKSLASMLESATGGRRTLRFNKDGVPSVFYRLPMFYLDDIISTWPHKPHPAFVLNDQKTGKEIILREILVGCYEASLVDDKYAVSQPGKLPHTYQPFDIALAYCRANNVPGGISVEYEREHANEYVITANGELDEKSYFHMMTNAEYSAIALWCWKRGNEPRGNSWYGQNGFYPEEKGKYPTKRYNYDTGELEDPYLGMPGNTQKYVTDGDPSSGLNPLWGNCPTVTGSSPLSWMHDGTPCGIENIVGNVSAMVAGLRVYNGQLQSFVNNNAALPGADLCGRVPLSPGNALDTGNYDRQTYYSEDWKGYKAFNLSGELVHPSTANTLKIDGSYMSDGRKTPVYEDGKLVRTYGCGKMAFATKIDVPDSGGTDQTKYSYDEDTGTFYLDPVNGVGNGSASNSFQTLQLDPDNPADTSNPVRAEDGQPGYLMRALGLYPICAHADLYPSVSQAQAADRDETNPITGIMSPVKHEGYYYDNGYLTEEIKAAYNTQRGRVWSRVPGDRPAQRGGVYYYEDPEKYDDPDDPNCSLWTTSYANRRYETARTNVPGAINVSDIGIGWMNGYRLCVIEFEGGN